MSTKILGNEELNILRAKTPYSLPDNPSDKGFNARQIKTKFWEGYLLLFNWLKETQASLNNDFATTNSALLNESKRIDVILTYFSNGKANFAVKDRNNNIIDETYELKSEASTKFNQLIADIQSVERGSASTITGTQNINADGIQYTITLSNTQNANLSTITQYLPLATTLKAGLLSSTDKEKINNIESDLTNFLANAKAYTDEKLQRDNIVNILGAASHTLIGLLSSEDKKKIDALYSLLGEAEDADTVVNTINEVLAIFSNYPEGVDIVSQLEKKVNYSDVINTLDSEETSKPLSAKMGKELKTKVDTKAELAYVNEELDKKALKSDILVIDEAVTAQESEITTTQSEGDKLVDEIVGYIDGSPRGVYASLSALQSAFPSGAQGVYLTSDNGHWNYYNNGWKDGGVYQAIADESISFNKTDFIDGIVNILDLTDTTNNIIKSGYYCTNANYPDGKANSTYAFVRCKVEPNTTYTIKAWFYFALIDEDGTFTDATNLGQTNLITKTFTTNANTKYVLFNTKPSELGATMVLKGNTYLDKFYPFGTYIHLKGNQVYAYKDEIPESVETYYVGATRTYTTFTQCIRALANNTNKKVIYIDAGIYDIFNEIGGSEYALSIASGTAWIDCNDIIPDNTTIIGLGDVIFNFMPTAEQIGNIADDLLSPINVQGNVTIENITINADNCRYCIHDETGDGYENSVKNYKNVRCYKYVSGGLGKPQAYASGFYKGVSYNFENCYFQASVECMSFHDRNFNGGNININNCAFVSTSESSNNYSIRFGNVAYSQKHHKAYINNCYISSRIYINAENGNETINSYDLQVVGCNNPTISIQSVLATNIYTPKVYN